MNIINKSTNSSITKNKSKLKDEGTENIVLKHNSSNKECCYDEDNNCNCCIPCIPCIPCHPCPPGPPGPGFNSYLNGVILMNKVSILTSGTIIYDTVDIVGADFSYNATTGVYVFQWKISVTPGPLTFALQIDLVKSPSLSIIGGISVVSTNPVVTGSNIIYAAEAGEELAIINGSIGAISIVYTTTPEIIGTISVFRIT
ncbi:hypothetical protein [Clostridium sp.]|uniref:hypothetical protein n=1 Tax=Clostridium sp. TaxID=1506 RepID=UPI003D6D5755